MANSHEGPHGRQNTGLGVGYGDGPTSKKLSALQISPLPVSKSSRPLEGDDKGTHSVICLQEKNQLIDWLSTK